MDLHLQNKVIIVTGGARGIGFGIAEGLAKEGVIPVIVGNVAEDNEIATSKIKKMGAEVLEITTELTQPDQCKLAIEKTINQFGRIDGLVNNAGINDSVGLEHGSHDQFTESLNKNVVHYYVMAQLALPHLKKSKGSIVNISSKVAETGQGNTSGYAAANGGRNALTREWAVELLPYGIRVNAIIVAESYTPLYENWINTFPQPEEKLKSITAKIPFEKRMTTTAEIADTALFLLSDRSSHTTGQLIHVDGGYTHLDRAIQ